MSTITETPTIDGVGEGILYPLQRHQFFIQYNLGLTELGGKLLTQQTLSFSLNAKDDEFTVRIEQPSSFAAEFLILISDLARPNSLSTISLCKTINEPTEIARFGSCECIHHNFNLTYSGSSEVAVHELKFKYKRDLLSSVLN